MKSESWLLLEIGAALVLFAVFGFFFKPASEALVLGIIAVFSSAFSGIVGYKFGRTMPQQAGDPKPGQAAKTETVMKVSTATDETDKAVDAH